MIPFEFYHKTMEEVYSSLSPDNLPWNISEPPEILVGLVYSGKVKPCRGIDLGCGTGNYTIYLAEQGFKMTGLDISPSAIGLAIQKAREKNVAVDFCCKDMLTNWELPESFFEFALEWDVLHHIYPEDRLSYVEKVAFHLKKDAIYLSVCFHERDPNFGGTGKFRTTSIGTCLYFSNENELKTLFEPWFRVLESSINEIAGKTLPHKVNYFLLKKR